MWRFIINIAIITILINVSNAFSPKPYSTFKFNIKSTFSVIPSNLHATNDPYEGLFQKFSESGDVLIIEKPKDTVAVTQILSSPVPETATPIVPAPQITVLETAPPAAVPVTVIPSETTPSLSNDFVNAAQSSVKAIADLSQETSSSIQSLIPPIPTLPPVTDFSDLLPKSPMDVPTYSIETHGLLLRAIQQISQEAIDAAQRATTAASELSTPAKVSFQAYVATKATVATSVKLSAASASKVPTLWQYIESGQAATDQQVTLETLRSNLAQLREEIIRQQEILLEFVQQQKDNFNTFAASPVAPWYAAAFVFMITFWQRKAGENHVRKVYELEMIEAKKKAEAAAEAARVAAEGAKKALYLAKLLPTSVPSSTKDGMEISLLERSKIRQMEVERELMQVELERLREEAAELRRTIDMIRSKEAEEKVKIPKVSPSTLIQEQMQRDPEEDSRILQVIKAIDDENFNKKRLAQEEVERKLLAEKQALQRAAEEAAAKKKAEEDALTKRLADQEALAKRWAAEDIARKKALEDEAAKKKAQAEAAIRMAEEKAFAKKKALEEEEENAKKKARDEALAMEEEAAKKKAQVEAAIRMAEELALAKKKALEEEEKAKKKAKDEALAAKKKKAKDEALAMKKMEELKMKKAEEDALVARKAEEEALAKKAIEEALMARKAEEEALAKKAIEEALMARKAEEEALAKKAIEEALMARKAEEEALAKKAIEEEAITAKKKAVEAGMSEIEGKKKTRDRKKTVEGTIESLKSPRVKKSVEPAPIAVSVSESPKEFPINPWASMKESTLMRKTLAELKEYLSTRNVVVDGKSKAELVSTIQSM